MAKGPRRSRVSRNTICFRTKRLSSSRLLAHRLMSRVIWSNRAFAGTSTTNSKTKWMACWYWEVWGRCHVSNSQRSSMLSASRQTRPVAARRYWWAWGITASSELSNASSRLKDLDIDAVVATTPYYFVSAQSDLIGYFTRIADRSPVPLYLYDLPQVTKVKIELDHGTAT